jgi:hypothetical protein
MTTPHVRVQIVVATAALMMAMPRTAHAEPDPPVVVALVDVPAVAFAGASLVSVAINMIHSANAERVPVGWGVFGLTTGFGACVLGALMLFDVNTSVQEIGGVVLGSGAMDLGTLLWNARYSRLTAVSLTPRVFTSATGQHIYGAQLAVATF